MKKIYTVSISLFFIVMLSASGCFGMEKEADFNSYNLIDIVTGQKLNIESSKKIRMVNTHLIVTSEIKKVLIENNVDISQIDVFLDYAPLFVDTTIQETSSNQAAEAQTISSPWLQIVKKPKSTEIAKLELHINATHTRLIADLFSEPEEKTIIEKYIEIPSFNQTCFETVIEGYVESANLDGNYKSKKLPTSFSCLPNSYRIPIFSLLKTSNQVFLFPFIYSVEQNLENCQDIARKYYSDLYPRLATLSLQLLENKSHVEPLWWSEIVKKTEPIQKCNA